MRTKRILSLFMICILLASGAALADDNVHCRIGLQFDAANQVINADFDLYSDGEALYILSSMFPSYILTDTAGGMEAGIPGLLEQAWDMLLDEQTLSTVREYTLDWLSYMDPEVRTGVFAGEAFDCASKAEHIVFSYADLLFYIYGLSDRLAEAGIPMDPSEIISGKLPDKNCLFDLTLYDDGKYFSMNVKNSRQEVIMTVSADISIQGQALVIIGIGQDQKNYYLAILLNQDDENHLAVTAGLYADDYRLGFQTMNDSNVIISGHLSLQRLQDKDGVWQTDIIAVITPGRETMPPVEFNGILSSRVTGRVLEAEAGFSENNDFNLKITLDADTESMDSGDRTFVDINSDSQEKIDQFSQELMNTMAMPMMQIMRALPEDYMNLLMDLEF